MSQVVPQQHPAVVLRSHYVHLRTLLAIARELRDEIDLTSAPGGRAALVSVPGSVPPCTGGRVAVVSAGTSDIAVAAEAALMATEMGCEVRTAWDVGVAGIHRLVQPLEQGRWGQLLVV